jgi:hypothetical protein
VTIGLKWYYSLMLGRHPEGSFSPSWTDEYEIVRLGIFFGENDEMVTYRIQRRHRDTWEWLVPTRIHTPIESKVMTTLDAKSVPVGAFGQVVRFLEVRLINNKNFGSSDQEMLENITKADMLENYYNHFDPNYEFDAATTWRATAGDRYKK